jgi:TP901 family phage tail tape measure protein
MANYNLGEARGKIILETDLKSLKEGQSAIDNAKSNAERAAASQQEAWKKTGTAATVAGAAVVAGFGVAVAAASSFEFQLSAIQAVSGATADEMKLISDAALRIGKDTSFSASEAAQAMEELVKAGISTEDVLNGAADATVALAAAGGVDLPTAATIASNAMNQFNLSAEDMVGITDSIAGAANASAIDVNDLGMSMGQVGAVANLLGLTFDDTALAIAAMGNAGIKGSDAGTSLKTMLMNLQPSTAEAAGLMKELGIITEDGANKFFDAEGKIRSMAEISDVLSTALAGMSESQKAATLTTLFGTDAVRGAAIVANTGAEGFKNLSEQMHEVSAADVAATRMDNLKGSTEALMGSLETLWINIGTQLVPVIRKIVDSLSAAVDWFGSLDQGVQNAIVGAIGIAGALALVFGATIKAVQGIQAAVTTIKALELASKASKVATVAMTVVQGIATAAQWAWNAALTANPIGIIIAAIAALVGAIIWFFTQTDLGRAIWANFMQFLQEAWTNISSFFTTVWQGMVDVATAVWNGIMDVVGAVVTWFQTYVWPIIQFVIDAIVAYFTMYYNIVMFVWNGIMTVVGAVVDWFMAHVYPTIKAVVDFLVALFNYLWQWVVFIWNGIVSAVTTVVDGFVSWLTDVWNNFLLGWNIIWTAISQVVTDIWNNIVSVVKPIIDGFVSWIVDLWNKFQLGWAILWAAVQQTISTIWNAIKNVVQPIVQGIVDFITNTWSGIVSFVTTTFNNVKDAIMNPIKDALAFIGTIKDQIMGFMAGAGDWLYNAGRSIIEGFIKGLESMFHEVGNFFRDLTNMIPETKGPPARDKVLLYDNGALIMKSLANGLASEMGDVYGVLNGMNATIPATLNSEIAASVTGVGTKAPVTINFTYNAAEGDTLTEQDVLSMLGHASELVREELD